MEPAKGVVNLKELMIREEKIKDEFEKMKDDYWKLGQKIGNVKRLIDDYIFHHNIKRKEGKSNVDKHKD